MSKFKDLSGNKYQHLNIVRFLERKDRKSLYLCRCDCGKEVILSSQAFKDKKQMSCGCQTWKNTRKIDMAGKRFNKLLVLEEFGKRRKEILWDCLCDCGNHRQATGYDLSSGKTISCLKCSKERVSTSNITHNMTGTKIYHIYWDMRMRCYNDKVESYSYCGAKGTIVCDEWMGKNGFVEFLIWSNDNGYVEGLSIDRIDNNKNYSPDNCRWTTMKIQQNNRKNNKIFSVDGIEDTMSNWSEKLHIPYHQLQRLDNVYMYTYNGNKNTIVPR